MERRSRGLGRAQTRSRQVQGKWAQALITIFLTIYGGLLIFEKCVISVRLFSLIILLVLIINYSSGKSLSTRLKRASKELAKRTTDLTELTSAVDKATICEWQGMIDLWQTDPAKYPDPYQ